MTVTTPLELARNSWDSNEYEAMQKVMATGQFTMGKEVKKFEEIFAQKFGSKYAVMCNSGSSANLLAVAALFYKKYRPVNPGEEAIVPAISWSTSYYPLQQYGLKLRFLDVELDTLNIDVSKLEKALTPKTRIVVAVNILGNPCALDAIRAFCDKHGLYLFEDNCESMGATLNSKACGTFGDIGTFSSFFSHHISTMEGGICTTENRELYDILVSLRSHGLSADTKIYEKSDFIEDGRFILPGYNVCPTELNGAIGIEQMKKLDRFIAVRRENGAFFQQLMQGDDRFIIQRENGKSSWFAFAVILNPKLKLDRKVFLKALKERGIEQRPIICGNFLRHHVIQYFDYETFGPIINADIAHDYGFYIGNHPVDIKPQLLVVREILDKIASP
ncbi:MAG: DegT/DnrJ/EryC1/StrS family aminotransferase [Chlamydiae bacterium]|nr:DegT/DnrJ/EryC1/StrS family aminotransferase [Chlamydiota bacterium]